MVEQAQDFRDESEALYSLIKDLSDKQLQQATAFKGWTINTVIGHLHMWNHAADLALRDGAEFKRFFQGVASYLSEGNLNGFEKQWLGELEGRALVSTWRETYQQVAAKFQNADPSARVEWVGPSMSVRSSITARLMETWAHGQEIYDLLGVERVNHDRIKNIVILGINTYGWTFRVNGRDAPEPVPEVSLVAPSGETWTFNEGSDGGRISGRAEEFCQVVTQTRNIADTNLSVTGSNAISWMEIAQCFAGGPETPPAPGTRVRQTL